MNEDLWNAYDRIGLTPVRSRWPWPQTPDQVRIDQAALGEPLPYPDEAFDVVVCALAIHYAGDRGAAFDEFWRESLSALCSAATDAGFLIERVIEPVPAETMRERCPEDYEKPNKEPGFLILRLLKPGWPHRTAPRPADASASILPSDPG